jgi:hypothetical protein
MAKKKVKAIPGSRPVQTFTGFRTDSQFAFGDCSVRNDLNFAFILRLFFEKSTVTLHKSRLE